MFSHSSSVNCTSDSSQFEIDFILHLLLFSSCLYISLQPFLSLKNIAMVAGIIGKGGLIKASKNAYLS